MLLAQQTTPVLFVIWRKYGSTPAAAISSYCGLAAGNLMKMGKC